MLELDCTLIFIKCSLMMLFSQKYVLYEFLETELT